MQEKFIHKDISKRESPLIFAYFFRFCATQSFIRFIEERSFISDKNTYNAFFDDCIAKVDSSGQCLDEFSSLPVSTKPTF